MAGAAGASPENTAREVLAAFQVAWRTSAAAVSALDAPLADLAGIAALPAGARFVVDVLQAMIGMRLRRPGAEARVVGLLDGFDRSPLAADPELVQLASTAAILLVEPERIRTMARTVLSIPELDGAVRARLMYVVGIADAWSGDLLRGELGLGEARELSRRHGPLPLHGEATCLLGKVEALLGDVAGARRHLDEGRSLAVLSGSEWIAGGFLECSLALHLVTGDAPAYRNVLELLVAQDHGLDSGLYWEYRWELATVHARAGDATTARQVLDASRPAAANRPGSSVLIPWREWILHPDVQRCQALERAASELARPAERLLAARLAWLLGERHAELGQAVAAERLLRQAQRRYAAIGALGPLTRVRDRLLGVPPRPAPDPARSRSAFGTTALTEAERRVAIAVSAGLSNREVADTLFLSVRTVESHLGAVFRKLGVRNRTELALRR